MPDSPVPSVSKQDLAATADQLRGELAQLKAAIPGMMAQAIAVAFSKVQFGGDDMISWSGTFPNLSASIRKLPAVTWQGSASCVNGQIVITLTGG